MTDREKDKTATTEKDAGGNPGSTGTSQPSKSETTEEPDRVGTKVDIRSADSRKNDQETEPPDRLRDGTK